MACNAIWLIKYAGYFSSTDEWNFQFCHAKICIDFFYDILVYSMDWESHIKHLEIVLLALLDNHLYAKYSKCCFGMYQIDNLGHMFLLKESKWTHQRLQQF